MRMLYLIGLGLVDGDITLRGIEAMEKCDAVYCEFYTNKWMGDLKKLEKKAKKKIRILSREEVEGDFILKQAEKKNTALLVPGDPMTATTHFELAFGARAKGIEYEVVHAPSIYTSVAETGLQLYKFGRTTTIAYPEKNFSPSSPYDVIEMNEKLGLHTLVLLDTREDRQMTVQEGLEILLKIESKKGEKVITSGKKIVACCRLGGNDKKIKYGTAAELIKDGSVQQTPAVIIIPGELNFKEEEALELWK